MTADEVVDKFRTLRPEEQVRVLDQLLEIAPAQEVAHADDPCFDRTMEEVLVRHADLMRELAR